jgi:3-deoxy-D-manno-oct-2-ulosonic acid (Kdo) hydroxylase
MSADPVTSTDIARRLERGEVIYYPSCPFPLPQRDDMAFLLGQRLASRAHKNVSYDPRRDRAASFHHESAEQAERVRSVLAAFGRGVSAWLASVLPRYAASWKPDMVSYRPIEEATRKARLKARNDLLHIDAFPTRPTNGWRILRCFVNVNPSEPRVWVTSDPFARLLERFGEAAGLPGRHGIDWARRVQDGVLRLFRPGRPTRTVYDAFMLRLHDYLKANEEFQERCHKQFWKFPPGSAWMAITDTCSHAVLRGRFALEHSYFLAPASLALPDESPAALLARACGRAVLVAAA